MAIDVVVNGVTYQIPEYKETNWSDQLESFFEALADYTLQPDDIINDLTTGGATKVLSAEQGKTLKTQVDLKVATSSIVDNLLSTSATVPLSANQGKVLKTLIDAGSGGGTYIGKSSDYQILDSDGYETIGVTTGSSADIKITLPAASLNSNRHLRIIKVDSGTKYINIETLLSGENITYKGNTAQDIQIELQGSGVDLVSNGTEWMVMSGIECTFEYINSNIEAVYTTYYLGTMDADEYTEITVTNFDQDKVLQLIGHAKTGAGEWKGSSIFAGAVAGYRLDVYWTATTINFYAEAQYQSNSYRMALVRYL